MFNRPEAANRPDIAAIDDRIDKVGGFLDQVKGLTEKYGKPPAGAQPTVIQEEDDIPFGEVPPSRTGSAWPTPSGGRQQPTAQPQPQPRGPAPARAETREKPQPVQQSAKSKTFDVLPTPSLEPIEPSGWRKTWNFLKGTFGSLQILSTIGFIVSPKGLGGIAAFAPLTGLFGILFFTPGVLFSLFCVGLYARHAGRRQLFDMTWQVAMTFFIAKAIAIVCFQGKW